MKIAYDCSIDGTCTKLSIQAKLRIFTAYDTGTFKRYERPFAGLEEVSLTSLIVRKK